MFGGIYIFILVSNIFISGDKMQPQPQPTQPPYYPPSPQPKLLIVIVAVVVVIVLIVVGVLWAFVFSKGGEEEEQMLPPVDGTPYCTMSASTSGTETGKTKVNVTWMVSCPSRADIKWSDIPKSSAKVLDDGVAISNPTWKTWPTGTYVTGGDVITMTLNRTTVASGSIVKLILVHAPSGSTFGVSSVTLTYTT